MPKVKELKELKVARRATKIKVDMADIKENILKKISAMFAYFYPVVSLPS